jgi:hypothetical protein
VVFCPNLNDAVERLREGGHMLVEAHGVSFHNPAEAGM